MRGGIGTVVTPSGTDLPMAGLRQGPDKTAATAVTVEQSIPDLLTAILYELIALRTGMIEAGTCTEIDAEDVTAAAVFPLIQQ